MVSFILLILGVNENIVLIKLTELNLNKIINELSSNKKNENHVAHLQSNDSIVEYTLKYAKY
jgi:hypothetical protein